MLAHGVERFLFILALHESIGHGNAILLLLRA